MQLRISKSFLIDDNEHILREALVSKKSKWLRAWRKRKMVLFSNKITFCEEGGLKPKDSNIIYLGTIKRIQNLVDSECLMKIVTSRGDFDLMLPTPVEKQSWIDDIRQASRTLKIIRSKTSSWKNQQENICPNKFFCMGIQC